MKKSLKTLSIISATLLLFAGRVTGQDWDLEEGDSPTYEDYNRRAGSMFSDFDNDGVPDNVDPFDNEQFMPKKFRDYDNDGTPNIVDPYDNKKWLPVVSKRK